MEPAVTTTDSAPVIEIPKGEGYQDWRMNRQPETPQADSTTASADVQKTEETAVASEATHEQESKPQRKRTDAATRIPQLLDEVKDLKRQLEEARKPKETQADSSPAAVQPKVPEAPKKPKLEDFKTWDKYEEARDKFVEDLTEYKAKLAVQTAEAERTVRDQTRAMQEKLEASRERYADFDQKAMPAFKGIFEDKQIQPIVKAAVDASPVFTDLLYIIGASDKADLDVFLQDARTNPFRALEKLYELQRMVKEELAGGSKEEAEESKVPVKKAPKNRFLPPPPDPGWEASGRNATPPDAVQTAIDKGDVRAY